MRKVEVEDDLFEFVMTLSRSGEGFNAILRDQLGVPPTTVRSSGGGSALLPVPASGADEASPEGESALSLALRSPEFKSCRNATERYLWILSRAHKEYPERFRNVLNIAGRGRTYFARTEEEIAESGRSTFPRRIPATDYWALTNADTNQKKNILDSALRVIGYDSSTIQDARTSLDS